ncbi:hypothetical protein ACO1O0_002446 [Amphichorda felina]
MSNFGKIAIGNVIVDSLKPDRAIVKPDPESPFPTETATEKNWQLSVETVRHFSLTIWAIFLQKISIKFGATQRHVKDGQFSMQSLHTVSLKDDPSDEYIEVLCKNATVREYMRLDSPLCKPVYIVTGLKIAEGFRMAGTDKHSAGLMGDVAPESSLGAGANVSSSTCIFDQFESVNDIIFAYQLMMIKPKGWSKKKKIERSDFRNHALLSDGNDEAEEKVEAERGVLEPEDVRDSKGVVKLTELKVDGLQGVNVIYKEA